MSTKEEIQRIHRRARGWHDQRFDGIEDLVTRAAGTSVLDLGCNCGEAGLEMAHNGATLVHGCDLFQPGIQAISTLMAQNRKVEARFEVFDLTKGVEAFDKLFGKRSYDIVLMFSVWHKVRRQLENDVLLRHIIKEFALKATRYVGGRFSEEDLEYAEPALTKAGLHRVQWSTISDIGPAGIWAR